MTNMELEECLEEMMRNPRQYAGSGYPLLESKSVIWSDGFMVACIIVKKLLEEEYPEALSKFRKE